MMAAYLGERRHTNVSAGGGIFHPDYILYDRRREEIRKALYDHLARSRNHAQILPRTVTIVLFSLALWVWFGLTVGRKQTSNYPMAVSSQLSLISAYSWEGFHRVTPSALRLNYWDAPYVTGQNAAPTRNLRPEKSR